MYIYIYIIYHVVISQSLPRHFRLPVPASADFPPVAPGAATTPPPPAAPAALQRGRAPRSGRSGSESSAGARGNDAWRQGGLSIKVP